MPDLNVNELNGEVTAPVEITAEIVTGPTINIDIIDSGPPGPQGIQGPPGQDGVDGQDGAPGTDGADGVSPVISSESITGGHRLTIVDAGGTTTVDVMDGQDGQDGTNGTNGTDGQDGVSPEVSIASITGGHSVTITDAEHPTGQTFNVMDGADGQDGSDGADGADGVSPGVTIASITGGHSVTITDADHPGGQSFNVMDGEDGQNGVGVPASGSTGQVLAKKSGTDYDTEWITPSAGSNDVEWVTYGSTTSATIETAYQAGKIVAVLSGDRVHYLQKRNSSTDHLFYAAIDTRFYVCRCTSDSWSNYYYECLELGDTGTLPSGGNAGQILAKNSATDYDVHWVNKTQDYPSAYCTTAAGTAAKKASCSLWADTANSYLHVLIGQANTSAGAITLNVNSTGAKPIYINGEASSATNYTLPAGSYIVFYDGTNFYFRTDGKLTADITGTADSILHVGPSAPSDPDIKLWVDTSGAPNPFLDLVYPVGSIYLSVNSTSPGSLFGGTWSRIKDTFLLAAGDTYSGGDTGGSEKHTHEYGIQYGTYYYRTVFEGDSNAGVINYDAAGNKTIASKTNQGSKSANYPNASSSTSGAFNHERSVGDTSYTSNMPPYLAVYVWQRTA